ncbi:MAG: tRNA (guanosine(37)-N1)-methyltransferase TrmD [Acidimicrobiia bacterium]|nr:tRNA (guanosine(37)-N1)-methyltransferase TrmD [Acidimicrobiia bacterium]
MRICVITLFPELVTAHSRTALLGRAVERGIVDVVPVDLRVFGRGAYHQVDDEIFGGGPGMVLRADVVAAAVDTTPTSARRLVLAPWGRRLDHTLLAELAAEEEITLLCGRYEGIDQRVLDARRFEAVSIGDYVIAGGEVAALVVIEGVTRLLPGVMGNAESATVESHVAGLLEAPCYTRPAVWEGHAVPEVLRSGDHARIEAWRREESLRRTARHRPDLLGTDADRE